MTEVEAMEQGEITFSVGGVSGGDRLSDRAADQLRTLIITLQLVPGALLDEGEMSRRLDCGRTPLREAIHRLAEERLVIVLPRRAVQVSPITIADLQQIHEVRAALEGTAARLAASRMASSQVRLLADLDEKVRLHNEKKDLTPLETVHFDFKFHYTLAKSADNTYLDDSIRRILGPAMRLSFLAYRNGQPSEEMYEEHVAIVHAIADHDPDEAERVARHHIMSAKDRTLARL